MAETVHDIAVGEVIYFYFVHLGSSEVTAQRIDKLNRYAHVLVLLEMATDTDGRPR